MNGIDVSLAKRVAAKIVLLAVEASPGDECYLKGSEIRFQEWLISEGLGDQHEIIWAEAVRENWRASKSQEANRPQEG